MRPSMVEVDLLVALGESLLSFLCNDLVLELMLDLLGLSNLFKLVMGRLLSLLLNSVKLFLGATTLLDGSSLLLLRKVFVRSLILVKVPLFSVVVPPFMLISDLCLDVPFAVVVLRVDPELRLFLLPLLGVLARRSNTLLVETAFLLLLDSPSLTDVALDSRSIRESFLVSGVLRSFKLFLPADTPPGAARWTGRRLPSSVSSTLIMGTEVTYLPSTSSES